MTNMKMIKNSSKFVVLLLLILSAITVIGQELPRPNTHVRRFELQHELSSRNIKSLVEDAHGFLWIGTANGLNRYDGDRITTYYANTDNPTSLNDNYIQGLFIDSNNTLWVLTPSAFCRYNEALDNFTCYKYATQTKNTHTSNPGDIIEDKQGIIWIGTPEQGLYSFDRRYRTFRFHSLPALTIDNLAFDDDGDLWVGSRGKIFVYNTTKNTYTTVNVPNNEVVVRMTPYINMVLTRVRLYHVRGSKPHMRLEPYVEYPPYKEAEILSFLGNKNSFWYGTRNKGLIYQDRRTKQFYTSVCDRNNPNTLSDNTVRVIFEDSHGVIWVGTDDGLNSYLPYSSTFANYASDETSATLVSNIVTGFAEDTQHNVWVSTYDGLSCFSPDTHSFTNYTHVVADGRHVDLYPIRDIASDQHGNVWLLLKQALVKLDTSTGTFHYIELKRPTARGTTLEENITADDLLCVMAENHNVWVGTYGFGMYQIDNGTGRIVKVYNTDNSHISSNYVKDIIRLDDGRLCIASLRTGLDIFDQRSTNFKNIRFANITHNYVSDYINNVMQDNHKNIWALSWHGAFVLDPSLHLLHTFTVHNGLPSNELNATLEDTAGHIWLGTTNGLSRINKIDKDEIHLSTYTVEDGLASNLIAADGLYYSADRKTIYVATTNGFNTFTLNDVPVTDRAVKPTLTALDIFNHEVKPGSKVNGQVVLSKALMLTNHVELNHHQRSITLHFASLDFSQGHAFRYAYKLEGQNKDWIFTTKEHSANYSNLRPGRYLFRIKMQNSSGIWSDETTLSLQVLPPWWATWWARTLYVLAIIALVIFVARIRLHQERLKQNLRFEKLQHDKENELNDIRMRFYTNISHDIRTPLTLIVGPLRTILKNEPLNDSLREQLSIIKKNAQHLMSLINQLLDFRKLEANDQQMKVSEHDVVDFVSEIVRSFDLYAKQKKIDLQFHSNRQTLPMWFNQQLLSKVFYNLISNAVKFTNENGFISVSLTDDNDYATVRVTDTGIGIPVNEQKKIFEDFYQIGQNNGTIYDVYTTGTGIGLTIVKRYVEMHHGQISVESQAGKGSTFTIRLPKGNSHYESWQIETDKTVAHADTSEPTDTTKPTMRVLPTPQSTITTQETATTAQEEADKTKNSILVVDNPDILHYLSSCLEPLFTVIRATNGREALETAMRELPDLVISDVMMPEMDGFTFAQQLKKTELTQHIPLLFLTARVSFEDTTRGLGIGATDYITKPFNDDILLAKVRNLINDSNRLKTKIMEEYNRCFTSIRVPRLQPTAIQATQRDTSTERTSLSDTFLQHIVNYISENVETPDFTADTVAAHFNLSKLQLYRRLKAVADLTATDIIRQQRMQRAETLLLTTDLTVSEIAYRLDFSNPFHFSKMFKKHAKLSPQQFRETNNS